MKATKTIVTPSLIVYTAELEELWADGWRVDFINTPPSMFGISYEVGLSKEVDENEPVKLSRAEILANARAAKAAKKDTSGDEEQ